MLKSGSSPARPSSRSCSQGMPSQSWQLEKAARIWSSPKRSWPAGTGVCVVKIVVARTSSRASSKPSPFATAADTRSSARKAACPSFRWNTLGSMPKTLQQPAASAIPRAISCKRRVSGTAAVEVARDLGGPRPSCSACRRRSGTATRVRSARAMRAGAACGRAARSRARAAWPSSSSTASSGKSCNRFSRSTEICSPASSTRWPMYPKP